MNHAFMTTALGLRAGTEIYELYQIATEKKWDSKWIADRSKQPYYVFTLSVAVCAVADLIFLGLRLTNRSVSPYAEWALLIPRILILGASGDFKNHASISGPVTLKASLIAHEQKFTIARKITPSAIAFFLPTVGKFCNYSLTGLEMICRTFSVFPKRPKKAFSQNEL